MVVRDDRRRARSARMSGLHGKRVLITGASSGIGQATARLFAADGARVACVARRAEPLEALATEIGGVPVVGDISQPQSAKAAVDEAVAALDGLDVLVNNAGLYLVAPLSDADPGDWQRMFDTNVLGVLYCTQAALPALRAAPTADIVNINSFGGKRVGRSSTAVYSATKYALNALTDGFRLELADTDIRVTSVAPGVVATELGRGTQDPTLLDIVREKQQRIGLDADVIARQIVHVVKQPPEVAVHEILVMPHAQKS
jgi:NADP-dependent 3-hydroxy acid dehydrogenase YdfG